MLKMAFCAFKIFCDNIWKMTLAEPHLPNIKNFQFVSLDFLNKRFPYVDVWENLLNKNFNSFKEFIFDFHDCFPKLT